MENQKAGKPEKQDSEDLTDLPIRFEDRFIPLALPYSLFGHARNGDISCNVSSVRKTQHKPLFRQNFPEIPSATQLHELWLPLEQRLHNATPEGHAFRALRSDDTRRAVLVRLFDEIESELPGAQGVVEIFSELLRRYAAETQRLLDQGGYSQQKAEDAALANLSIDAEFLHKATAYTEAYHKWLSEVIAPRKSVLDGAELPGEESRAHSVEDYVVQTSQEAATFLASICDGRLGKEWSNDAQAGTRTYERQGGTHAVQLRLTDDERRAGLETSALEEMTRQLDADGTFAVLYVSRLLAPPAPLPANAFAGGWVELDDVMKKIGWDPRSTAERNECRRVVWNYLRFCARANLMGRRTGVYRDPITKQEIPTSIDGPIWRFMKEERPVQPSLFNEEEVPVRVQIAVSTEWTHLSTSPVLAQFLPMGELLGSIRPDKPSGAWARALGLALAGFWRRQPRAALDGSIKPTRHELLTAYTPKIAPPEELFASKNPRRALEYWRGALQILVEEGFLAKSGEATRTADQMSAELPRYHWQQVWFDATIDVTPGPNMEDAVRRCADNLPVLKPENFKALPKKRGRPRKVK